MHHLSGMSNPLEHIGAGYAKVYDVICLDCPEDENYKVNIDVNDNESGLKINDDGIEIKDEDLNIIVDENGISGEDEDVTVTIDSDGIDIQSKEN